MSAQLLANQSNQLTTRWALLQAAHFRVLRADEWTTAQEENFTVRAVPPLYRSAFGFTIHVSLLCNELDSMLVSLCWKMVPLHLQHPSRAQSTHAWSMEQQQLPS